MNEDENEQLDEIHNEIQGSAAQLGRIDERTRNIQDYLESVSASVDENEEDINELQSQVKRNTTIVGGITAAAMGLLFWVSDKITRIAGLT